MAAFQAKMKADASGLEVSLLKQVVLWKDEVLSAIRPLRPARLAARVGPPLSLRSLQPPRLGPSPFGRRDDPGAALGRQRAAG